MEELMDEELNFFNTKGRAKILRNFAQIDLEADSKGTKRSKKLSKSSDTSSFDSLELIEDAATSNLKKMQKYQQEQDKKGKKGEKERMNEDGEKFEKTSRSWGSQTETSRVKAGLPVRTATGQWIIPTKTIVEEEEESSGETMIEKELDDQVEVNKDIAETHDSMLTHQMDVGIVLEKLALMALDITGETEENVSKLKDLIKYSRDMCCSSLESSQQIMKSALITLVAVFKDILPGYHIRPLTKEEKEAKVSKEVKKVRAFEELLIKYYKSFIDRLQEILKTNKKGDAPLVGTALGCLIELSCCLSHFNFADTVTTALAGQAYSGNEAISQQACLGVERFFSEDSIGKNTVLMTQLLSDMVHSHNYINEKVTPRIIKTFMSIRLIHLSHGKFGPAPKSSVNVTQLEAYKKKQSHMSRAQKKELKVQLAESAKKAQAEAEHSREERARWSSDTLKYLFRVFFGILKATERDPSRSTDLLPVVLSGLAKYSNYLGIDFYADLLATLKRIISNQSNLIKSKLQLGLLPTLHTIHTVVQINSLQENNPATSSLGSVDLKFYFDLFFKQLSYIPEQIKKNAEGWEEIEEAIEGVAMKLFFAKRHIPAERVGSFVHRMIEIALDLLKQQKSPTSKPHPSIIYFTKLAKRLLERHPKARVVLEHETFGISSYLPKCDDPDLCNPFSKRVEIDELAKLTKSPMIKSLIKEIMRFGPNNLTNTE